MFREQIKLRSLFMVYRLWHTFCSENVFAGSECFQEMNRGVLLLEASSSETIFLLLGQKWYLLCGGVEGYLNA